MGYRAHRAEVLFHPPPSVRPCGPALAGSPFGEALNQDGFGGSAGSRRRADGGDLRLVLGAARRQAVRGRTLAIVKAFARLTVVVLVVVAIGIGVSASSWNQPTYGPSWGRFSIEFPSAPTTHIPRERDIWFASDVTHGVHESVDVRVFRADQYWSSAAEQEREIDQIVGQAATVTRGDGVTVIAPPPFCAGVCADVEFVREGPTVWAVEAAASKQAGPWVNPDWHAVSGPQDESLRAMARGLLASFEPAG